MMDWSDDGFVGERVGGGLESQGIGWVEWVGGWQRVWRCVHTVRVGGWWVGDEWVGWGLLRGVGDELVDASASLTTSTPIGT